MAARIDMCRGRILFSFLYRMKIFLDEHVIMLVLMVYVVLVTGRPFQVLQFVYAFSRATHTKI